MPFSAFTCGRHPSLPKAERAEDFLKEGGKSPWWRGLWTPQQVQRCRWREGRAGLTLAGLMIRPMREDMSLCPGIGGLLRWCCGRPSDSVSVYECRRVGILAGLDSLRYRGRGVIHGNPAAGRGGGSWRCDGESAERRASSGERAVSWSARKGACVGAFTAHPERPLPSRLMTLP